MLEERSSVNKPFSKFSACFYKVTLMYFLALGLSLFRCLELWWGWCRGCGTGEPLEQLRVFLDCMRQANTGFPSRASGPLLSYCLCKLGAAELFLAWLQQKKEGGVERGGLCWWRRAHERVEPALAAHDQLLLFMQGDDFHVAGCLLILQHPESRETSCKPGPLLLCMWKECRLLSRWRPWRGAARDEKNLT